MKIGKKIKSVTNYGKGVVKKLKDEYWRAKCDYIKYYEELTVDENAILLESVGATQLNGNIFYIIKYLKSCEKYDSFTIYLASWGRYMKKMRSMLGHYGITGVKIVIFSSDEYVRLLASAKYLINDTTFPPYYIKKDGQIYLNTWHGTPLKTLGRRIQNDIAMGNVQKNFVVSDYLLYPNEFTKNVMIRDYMLENISSGSYILAGYPRNEVFFDEGSREQIKEKLNLKEKRIYAFMPTWRGTVAKVGSDKNNIYLMYQLYELDRHLTDDEILYVNFHPFAIHKRDEAEIKSFKHIRKFPANYETYDFLNIADVLITDYSSVFFDFACTCRKIVLFPYDKEEYLKDRGIYIDMDSLPFPQVFDVPSLVRELRSEKGYDDTAFIKRFNAYDGIGETRKLCDHVILGEDTGLHPVGIPHNGKENVLIYAGNLDKNGITSSLRSTTNIIDLDKRNYYISFYHGKAKRHAEQLATFNEKVNFFPIAEYSDLTVSDRIVRELYRKKVIFAKGYMKKMEKRIRQDFVRSYGTAGFDTVIQFNGYESEVILLYSRFEGRKAIFVHNDMMQEIGTRQNQRMDVLRYAYNAFDKVVTVSDNIIPSILKISGREDNIITVRNAIDHKMILARSMEDIELDPSTKCSVGRARFYEMINSDHKKFINIGRYSPEKGHDRLVDAFYRLWTDNQDIMLIIVGGNSRDRGYENLCSKVKALGLADNVILLLSVSNPYPILKACDYLILSSYYEGFGLVLAEADILGKPVVSTDIEGPRSFMKRYGGTVVDNSEDGIYDGLKLLYEDKVATMRVDYDVYNAEYLDEFERLFE